MKARTASIWLAVVLLALGIAPAWGAFLVGCDGDSATEAQVVLYTSVDEPIARRVIAEFENQTGHRVRLVTDTEATKSVGLAERLRAERDRPQADVWWGNEPFHTIALAQEGLFETYDSPAAADIEAMFRDPQKRWTGNGLRARVLVCAEGSQTPVGLKMRPRLEDLPAEVPRGAIGIARPTAGTTGGHVAALYVLWGQQKADAFFRSMAPHVTLTAGNSQVAQQVGSGNLWIGLTDNDDVANARAAGLAVQAIIPDQHRGGMGTLTIPTTVALVASRPPNDAARKLVDFLVSAHAEQLLFEANFAGWSVRASNGESAIRSMNVDYAQVAAALPEAVRRATAILEGREP